MKLKQNLLSLACVSVLLSGAAWAEPIDTLRTRTEQQVGVTISHYKYEEPNLMSLEAMKFGIDYTTTLTVDDSWFIRLDGRYANGDADYESSGTGSNDNLTDWYTEIRALFGTDYTLNDFVLAPYSGLGYRYLFNDLRGDSSSGAIGYRRESEYFYLPLGVIQRVALDEGSQLENNLEFDYLLRGQQTSHFDDLAGHGNFTYGEEIKSRQNHGYGLRASSMYKQGNWLVGPYLTYWDIEDSETTTSIVGIGDNYYLMSGKEPANNTLEYGVKGAYRF